MDYTKLIKQVAADATAYAKEQGWVKANWNCKLKIDTSPRRTRSWGGTRLMQPFMSLAINPHLSGNFDEYASFKHDPVIGSIKGNVEKALAALVCHEIAHAMQFSGDHDKMAGSNRAALYDVEGHGALWKKLYRELREKFVNNRAETSSAEVSREIPTVAYVSRKAAQNFAYASFLAGKRAPEIISALVTQGMKKTTATTYVYEVKRVCEF